MSTEEQVKEIAYSLWEQQGRPAGKDWEHYYAAQRILAEREAEAAYVNGQEHLKVHYPGRTPDNRPISPRKPRVTHPISPFR